MKKVLKGADVVRTRKALGLTQPSFARMFERSLDDICKWEEKGLRAPHDIEGPASVLIRLLTSEKIGVPIKKDALKLLGYKGPEKKYPDVDHLKYIKAGDWK